jgi:hypothetical protein
MDIWGIFMHKMVISSTLPIFLIRVKYVIIFKDKKTLGMKTKSVLAGTYPDFNGEIQIDGMHLGFVQFQIIRWGWEGSGDTDTLMNLLCLY